MSFYSKAEIILMDENGQISGSIADDAFEALNGLSELVGNKLVENNISDELDNETAKILGKKRKYGGLYNGIDFLIQIWKDWSLIEHLDNSKRILDKLKKGFSLDNIDLELHIMANIIRCGGVVEIIKETQDRTPDFRFHFNTGDKWIYGEITRRNNSTWKYAKKRAEELVDILKLKVIGEEGTLAIKEVLGNEQFERLKEWLQQDLESMTEFEGVALYYTNIHGIDTMDLSLKYIDSPFFCTGGHLFENNNFIRIHAPYIDGGIQGILENKFSQFCEDKKNILFIDTTQSTWLEWKNKIEEAFLNEKYRHISAIILLRMGLNIKTEVLIIPNIIASSPIPEITLDKIFQSYELI